MKEKIDELEGVCDPVSLCYGVLLCQRCGKCLKHCECAERAKRQMVKHIVGFSGGIDSQATARYVLNRYPKEDVILCNSNAGENEHPLTEKFVEEYSNKVHPVVKVNAIVADMWKTPGFAETRGFNGDEVLDFGRMIQIKGRPPSRKVQFCTEILKLRPQLRWIKEQFGPQGPYAGYDYRRYAGVRRDESHARAKTPHIMHDDYFDCETEYPIFDWEKQMCFDYVKHHGEDVNELYKLGFVRVGCAPCINSSKADITNWSIRFPEMIDKVRNWEKQSGRTFFAPMVPGKVMNDVDEVVAWARTARGGRQELFPIMHEREECESKFGLCE